MPRGLILLVLLLLIGGYFLIGSLFGGKSVSEVPRLTASAKVVPSSKGYTAVVEGKLELPAEKEYKIDVLNLSLLINGLSVKTEEKGGTTIKGPGEYPFSFSPDISKNAERVAIRVDANVSVGKTTYVLSEEIPVALPDPSTRVKPLWIDISVSEVKLLGSSKSVTVAVGLQNPNNSDATVNELKINFGAESYNIPISTVRAGKREIGLVSLSVPPDVTTISISLSGSYIISGVERSISRSFDINVPKLEAQPLVPRVSALYVSLSPSGYSVKVEGTIRNPNAFNVALDYLLLRLRKAEEEGYIYEENVVIGKDILPFSELNFSKEFSMDDDFSLASAELVAHYSGKDHLLAEFPVGLGDPTDFINPVVAKLFLDINTCSFTPYITNPNDFPVDIKDLSLVLKSGSSTLVEKNYDGFTLESGATKSDLSPVDANTTGLVVAQLTGTYGLSTLNVWIPLDVEVELNCST